MNYDRILVFGAHPDDEIAMAGTMAKLSAAGTEVYVAIYTDGSEGYPDPAMRDLIVETRAREQEECDRILGVTKRYRLNRPDMGLVNDKETFKETMRIIREARPDAIFNHGPDEIHRDHLNTHRIVVEARWQAAEPVAAELGPPWLTPHLFYYKNVRDRRPMIRFEVSETAYKRLEAVASQVSQLAVFRRTREDLLAEAERLRTSGEKHYETFWPSEYETWSDFPPKGL